MAEVKPKPVVESVQENQTPKFDPAKHYQWDPEAQFLLSGVEYDLIYKSLRSNLNNPTFVAHVQQYEALKLIEEIFKKGVEAGVITELPPPPSTKEVEMTEADEDFTCA
jgi:hypothetical protein